MAFIKPAPTVRSFDLTDQPPASEGEISYEHLWHPYANIFPLMEGPAFDKLTADIKANGLNYQIVMYQNLVLDGRNRYLACVKAGLNPEDPDLVDDFDGSEEEALNYVISSNLHRRHLDESQRAMAAQRLETLRPGLKKGDKQANLPVSRDDAARLLNVSRRSVTDAKAVADNSPALAKRVERGEVPVSLAADIARLKPEAQLMVVHSNILKKDVPVVDLPSAELRGVVKRERRHKRMEDLVEATEAASKRTGSQLFNVIYADPPWKFEVYSEITGMDRAADNHYPTMGTDEICEMPVPAAADAVLFLWATVPMLPQALEVLRAWGFDYKSNFVWVKDKIGTGYWGRNQHELLLIGTKGSMPAPAPGEQPSSVIKAPVSKHSAKPDEVASIIAGMFPDAAKIEMFARKERDGWESIGNELGLGG